MLAIDQPVGYALLSRAIGLISGPLTMFLFMKRLTPAEQGFYFTFNNFAGLSVFFELGLVGVVVQFASHEKAYLEWTKHGILVGNAKAKERLSSLLHKSLIWYGIAAALFVVCVIPAGVAFFGYANEMVSWRTPWICLGVANACTLLLAPLAAIIEGSGAVAEMAAQRMVQTGAGTLALCIALLCNAKLYSGAISVTTGLVCSLVWFFAVRRTFLIDLFRITPGSCVSWRMEVWPYQWRIAISWISGYFISQMFNPILFRFHGASSAARMGLSLAITSALSGVGLCWIATKAAPFGVLVARNEYASLDALFFKTLKVVVGILTLSAIIGLVFTLGIYSTASRLQSRLVDPLSMGCLLFAAVMNCILYAEAIYLRAHKREPFMAMSVGFGVCMAVSSYIFGKKFGIPGVCISYLTLTLCSLVAGTVIFHRFRRQWHFRHTLGNFSYLAAHAGVTREL